MNTSTCIVGLEHEGIVYLAGDSCASDGWGIQIRFESKVFEVGESIVIGGTSSFRMLQLMEFMTLPDAKPAETGNYRWLVTKFIPATIEAFESGGWLTKKHEQKRGGEFLVGVGAELFFVGGDFHVGRVRCGYNAVGSGAQRAIGSMYSTEGQEPEPRLLKAVSAAAEFSAHVEPPFRVVNTRTFLVEDLKESM